MKVNFENTYEHIGYLFYASACQHNTLSTTQLAKLTDIIESLWKPASNGDMRLHLHLVDSIRSGVVYAVDNKMNKEHALSSFHTYYQVHALSFSSSLTEKIVSSLAIILKEFPDNTTNELIKAELEYLISLIPVED